MKGVDLCSSDVICLIFIEVLTTLEYPMSLKRASALRIEYFYCFKANVIFSLVSTQLNLFPLKKRKKQSANQNPFSLLNQLLQM